MTKDPHLGLVVVGYESTAQWTPFLLSLEQSTITPSQVVLVDNSPPSLPSPEVARWKKTDVIRLPHNPGYGAAVNVGMSALNRDVTHVIVANPDIRFQPNTIKKLQEELTAFPQAAIAGPALQNSDGTLYPSARAIPGLRIGVGHALLGNLWPSNPWTRRYLGDYRHQESRAVGWVSGALFLVDRACFSKVSGFDERFFMFFEDVDLCHRMKKAGYRTIYVPEARALHEGGHSTHPRMSEMVKAHHQSARLFLESLYPRRYQAPLRVLLRAGLAARSILQQWKYRRLERLGGR